MKLITRNDIERWAETFYSKGDFPYLISRLVRATTPGDTQADFPSGSAAYIGGWDGIVSCQEDTPYVPKGISLYEFGTEENSKGKADKDYNKRKADPLGYSPSDSVFIFVTPRIWSKKEKWVKEKKAEGVWKDVKVYDSSDLEQWLDIALATSRWFSSLIGSYPFDGVMTADEFWDEWSHGPNGLILQPAVLIAGREYELQELLNTLQGKPSIKGIKASTKNEAVAFIIAAAKLFPSDESERFFSKSLIIDTEGNFRGIRINSTNPLILIPRFDEVQPLYLAVSKGHHVLVPLGADDTFNQEIINLPTINRDGQINSLINSGIPSEKAEKISREAGRNITILKKLLGFPHANAKWLVREDIREIVPALLLGRWDESFAGDRELIEKLSGKSYSEYLQILSKWKNYEESPLIQIGETWRLTSPLDLWANLSSFLIHKDFEDLQECFSLAFKNRNEVVKLENKNVYGNYFNTKKIYSNWSREGLAQSLILVGRFGEGLRIPNLSDSQHWVDKIIYDLLSNASGEAWISFNHELPLIAEASPQSFLNAVTYSLSQENPAIMDMFQESEGFLHTTSNHTGLLWALEGIAWMPEYLFEAGLILLKLSRLDPGGNLSNRPINSISEIFKPWHYQTLCTFDDRMAILKHITEIERESGWELLIRMLPDHHAVAHSTHKMRWRIFDKNTNLTYTYEEIRNTHSFVVNLLITQFDYTENKFARIIKEIVSLSPNDREKVFDWAESVLPKVQHIEHKTRETIRKILHHHRSYKDTDWALPEFELERLEKLYQKLIPHDLISQNIWLFNDHWPEFPEGFIYEENEIEKEHDQRQHKVDNSRTKAIEKFIAELGLEKTLELRKNIKELWSFGDALAKVITNQDEVIRVCKCLQIERDDHRFVHAFIFRKSIIEGFEWVVELLGILQKVGFNNKELANILLPIRQSQQLWEFISTLNKEIQEEYWHNMYPTFYSLPIEEKIIGVKMLMEYKRYFAAIDFISHYSNEMPSSILINLLTKAATQGTNESVRIKGYEFDRIFDSLYKRTDVDNSELINLEWLYLPILDRHGSRNNFQVLQDELAKNPVFFIDILKWVYLPKDREKLVEERKGIPDEVIQNRAKHAYHLLNSWKKIPGLKPDNSIDENELKDWIIQVRHLAEKESRLDVADMQIGQILAQYPENIPEWPQHKIFQIIEEVNSDSLKRNYSSSMFNKRGFSSRGAFEGGNIEREKAAYFDNLANSIKLKFPNVASVFKRLAEGYLKDAKRIDEDAERDRLEY